MREPEQKSLNNLTKVLQCFGDNNFTVVFLSIYGSLKQGVVCVSICVCCVYLETCIGMTESYKEIEKSSF